MGSSAGAGSGEFHVYRHIRRREYARQEYLNQLTEKDRLDLEYKDKLEENRRVTDERAAKKRAKRQRGKQRLQAKRRKGEGGAADKQDTSSESDKCSDVEGGDVEQSCEKEFENKEEEEKPITPKVMRRNENDTIVDSTNGADAIVDKNIKPDAVIEETVGDTKRPPEHNDTENTTNATGSAKKDALPTGEAVSCSPEKPQKKSLKELLKTTASKLNLELNIDR